MHKSMIPYTCGGTQLTGYLCHNKNISGQRPAVIVAHAWRGLDDFVRLQTEELARMGYIAFAADVYGRTQPATSDEEAAALMMPLFIDRNLLQERIQAAYRAVSQLPLVSPQRIGAIGFCFGGLTVIELLRSGSGVRGIVSFHGGFASSMGGHKAKTVPIAPNITGSALILHGHEDPLLNQHDIDTLLTEFTQANIDWSLVHYGHTTHAFTNPEADNPKGGMCYNEKAARRSWTAMRCFFDEVFQF